MVANAAPRKPHHRAASRPERWLRAALEGLTTRQGPIVLGGVLVIIALIAAAVAWTLDSKRTDVLKAHEIQSINLARTLSEQTVRVMNTLFHATESAQSMAMSGGLQGQVLQRLVAETGLGAQILPQLSWVDAKGRFVASNLDPDGQKSGRPDLSDRPHIRVHLTGTHPPGALYVGGTVTGKVSGKRSIQLSRALLDGRGQPAGIIVASVNIHYFEQLYQGLQLGHGGTLELAGFDRLVRARVVGGQPAFEEHRMLDDRLPLPAEQAEAVTILQRPTERRMYVGRRIEGYPLVIWISTDVDEALADWYQTRTHAWLLTAGCGLALLSAAGAMLHAFHRLHRSRATLKQLVAERTRHLSESHQALERKTHALEQTLQDLRAAQSQLVQSEKMATLGQLVANVAHEINTPLGAIKSSGHNISDALKRTLTDLPRAMQTLNPSQQDAFMALIAGATQAAPMMSTREERALLRQLSQHIEALGLPGARDKAECLLQLRAQSQVASYLDLLQAPQADELLATAAATASIVSSTDNINTAVERVSKIVFALKAYARRGPSDEFQLADLRHGLDTVLTIYQHHIRHGVELAYHADELPLVRCLPDELNQVWTNLIHNALQAMMNRGTLTIELRRRGQEVTVSVGDTGCGIPEDIRGKVFDPFFTTKPVGEGSGLGLDIVRQIVNRHGGRIGFDTELNVGTTFHVTLPLAPPAHGASMAG